VFRYQDYRKFLSAFYAYKKPLGLSYRGFARAAGLGAPNYLKLVIEGKRNLSPDMAERFAHACRLNGESTEYFKALVAFNQAKSDEERNQHHERLARFARFRASQRLDLAQRDYHSSWYIPAIRELIACPGYEDDPAWIAAQLVPAITERQAAQALDVLEKLELVERDERGRRVQVTRAVTTGRQASGLYIRNYHAQMIERAVQSMHDIPADERFVSALTLSVSDSTLDEVRRRVNAFREELVALCDADPAPSQIIQLNLQLFPLSRAFESCEERPPNVPHTSPSKKPALPKKPRLAPKDTKS
jgi:uncharacterized protein (TIGR02147 family)